MSAPALENWFSISARRNRKSFIVASLLLYATIAILLLGWYFFAETQRAMLIGFIIFIPPAILCHYLLIAQRLRDFGVSGWFSLLWLLGLVVSEEVNGALSLVGLLVLWGIPGTAGVNNYGPDPLAR